MQIVRSLHWYISHFRWVGTALQRPRLRASSRISPTVVQPPMLSSELVNLLQPRFTIRKKVPAAAPSRAKIGSYNHHWAALTLSQLPRKIKMEKCTKSVNHLYPWVTFPTNFIYFISTTGWWYVVTDAERLSLCTLWLVLALGTKPLGLPLSCNMQRNSLSSLTFEKHTGLKSKMLWKWADLFFDKNNIFGPVCCSISRLFWDAECQISMLQGSDTINKELEYEWNKRNVNKRHIFMFLPDPRKWSREDVKNWLLWMSHRNKLPGIEPARFQMNGKALCLMSLQMFTYRVPVGGKLLYKDFQLRLTSAFHRELYETKF